MNIWHKVIGTSFGDPDDIRKFKACKAKGRSDIACFKVGDNAIGLWKDSTATGTGPSCALPPEVWTPFYHLAHLKKVLVKRGDKQVTCLLKDTLPHRVKKIDLNPDALKALGEKPPFKGFVYWKWA